MSDEPDHSAAPPVGEQVHMPEHSVLPVINAAALALAIVSLTLSWWLVGIGLIIFVATTIRWVADVRRDISNLPLEHQ